MENRNSFACPICGNTDIHSIGYLNGKPYCRRCISFRGEEVERKPSYPKKAPIHLEYELSPEQKRLSNKLVENYKKGVDSLFLRCVDPQRQQIHSRKDNTMSRKRKRKSTYQRRYKKPLIKGKFYRVKDSNGGHPSKLFRKNTKKNKYWIVRFTSSPGRHRTKLKHQIDPQRDGDSFVINNPTIEKYEDFSSPHPLDNLRVHKDDLKLVRKIQKKKR